MNFEKELKLALKSNSIEQIHSVFEKIYSFYVRLVHFTISKYISSPSVIEELTQDVFIVFFNHLNSSINNIKYYLLITAKNKSIDYLKSNNSKIEYSDLKLYRNIIDESNSINYTDIINRLKEYLNDFEIEILIEHILYGYSFKELSKKYNKPLNTIKSIYLRAKNKIKERSKTNEF